MKGAFTAIMSSKVGMLGEKIEVGDLLFYISLLVFTVIIYFVLGGITT